MPNNYFQSDIKSFIEENFSKALREVEAYENQVFSFNQRVESFKHAELSDERLKEIREKYELPENHSEIVSISFYEPDRTKVKELQEFNFHFVILSYRERLAEAERNCAKAREDFAFIKALWEKTKTLS